jgi:peptidoglycan hydrolase-like protein with peptidoglycan-binding domain
MLKKIFVILPFIVVLSSPALANSVAQSQRMLNQLGYNSGPVDGAYGKKTRSALEIFYSENGGSYDGKLDANEVADLTAAMDAAGLD